MPEYRLTAIPTASTDTTKVNSLVVVVDQNHKQWSCIIVAVRGTVVDAQTASGIKFYNVQHINLVQSETPPYWRSLSDNPGNREQK